MNRFPEEHNERVHLEPLRDSGIESREAMLPAYSEMEYSKPFERRRTARSTKIEKSSASFYIKIICQLFSLSLSLATISVLARAIELYDTTKNSRVVMSSGLVTVAWPSTKATSLTPIYLLLSAAVISAGLSIIEGMMGIFKYWKKRRTCMEQFFQLVGPLTILRVFTAALIVFRLQIAGNGIVDWSCAHRHVEVLFDDNEIGLGWVCDTAIAAWDMGIAIAGFQLIALAVAARDLLKGCERPKKGLPFIAVRRGYYELGTRRDQDVTHSGM